MRWKEYTVKGLMISTAIAAAYLPGSVLYNSMAGKRPKSVLADTGSYKIKSDTEARAGAEANLDNINIMAKTTYLPNHKIAAVNIKSCPTEANKLQNSEDFKFSKSR